MCIDKARGISLIELVMFMVIISLGIAGILSVMNFTTQKSNDPAANKQALAIAESLLEEVEQQPFTYCDPNDATAATATDAFVGAGGCTTTAQMLGPQPASETRYVSPQFDNVSDYHGFSMTPIVDISNAAIPGLGAYTASITISQAGTAFNLARNADALKIDVRVVATNVDLTLSGYRFRYAPNAVP